MKGKYYLTPKAVVPPVATVFIDAVQVPLITSA
jgi:hypothetical protein